MFYPHIATTEEIMGSTRLVLKEKQWSEMVTNGQPPPPMPVGTDLVRPPAEASQEQQASFELLEWWGIPIPERSLAVRECINLACGNADTLQQSSATVDAIAALVHAARRRRA